jgi:hypothetical protein
MSSSTAVAEGAFRSVIKYSLEHVEAVCYEGKGLDGITGDDFLETTKKFRHVKHTRTNFGRATRP